MLKGVDPVLSGELLRVLDEMGHGDQLALVDRNYPAASAGRPVIRLGEVTVVRAMTAILSVFPLDEFVERPLARMEVDGDASRSAPVQDEALAIARTAHSASLTWAVIPRLEFYGRARECAAIVHTLESRPWGCLILQKGVVFPDDE